MGELLYAHQSQRGDTTAGPHGGPLSSWISSVQLDFSRGRHQHHSRKDTGEEAGGVDHHCV